MRSRIPAQTLILVTLSFYGVVARPVKAATNVQVLDTRVESRFGEYLHFRSTIQSKAPLEDVIVFSTSPEDGCC